MTSWIWGRMRRTFACLAPAIAIPSAAFAEGDSGSDVIPALEEYNAKVRYGESQQAVEEARASVEAFARLKERAIVRGDGRMREFRMLCLKHQAAERWSRDETETTRCLGSPQRRPQAHSRLKMSRVVRGELELESSAVRGDGIAMERFRQCLRAHCWDVAQRLMLREPIRYLQGRRSGAICAGISRLLPGRPGVRPAPELARRAVLSLGLAWPETHAARGDVARGSPEMRSCRRQPALAWFQALSAEARQRWGGSLGSR